MNKVARKNTPRAGEQVREVVEDTYRNYGTWGDRPYGEDVSATTYFENGRWHASVFPSDDDHSAEIVCVLYDEGEDPIYHPQKGGKYGLIVIQIS